MNIIQNEDIFFGSTSNNFFDVKDLEESAKVAQSIIIEQKKSEASTKAASFLDLYSNNLIIDEDSYIFSSDLMISPTKFFIPKEYAKTSYFDKIDTDAHENKHRSSHRRKKRGTKKSKKMKIARSYESIIMDHHHKKMSKTKSKKQKKKSISNIAESSIYNDAEGIVIVDAGIDLFSDLNDVSNVLDHKNVEILVKHVLEIIDSIIDLGFRVYFFFPNDFLDFSYCEGSTNSHARCRIYSAIESKFKNNEKVDFYLSDYTYFGRSRWEVNFLILEYKNYKNLFLISHHPTTRDIFIKRNNVCKTESPVEKYEKYILCSSFKECANACSSIIDLKHG